MKKPLFGVVVLIVLLGGFFLYKDKLGGESSRQSVPQVSTANASGGAMGGSGRSAEFEKSHKYALQLVKLIGSVGRLEEAGKDTLTPAQARSVLSILQPLREQDSLDEPTAREAVKSLQDVLTDKQRAAINALPAEKQFRRAGPPQGALAGKRPSGPPPGAGGPGGMKNFNPLSQPAGGPEDKQRNGGMDKLFDSLKKKREAAK